MALNYDPILNRMRTFRFRHGKDMESLLQERPEDVLDIEEYGAVYQKWLVNRLAVVGSFIGLQVVHSLVSKTNYFQKSHPYARVLTRAFFLFSPIVYSNVVIKPAEKDFLIQILSKKIYEEYEDPITPKYEDLYST